MYECSTADALNTNGGYKLFDSNLYFPDLTQYDIEGVITSETLTKVHFELKAEALQSTNVNATMVADLHTIINENQIFNDYTNLGFVLEYKTFGGEAVKGQIITNEDVTLPKVAEKMAYQLNGIVDTLTAHIATLSAVLVLFYQKQA